MTKYKIYNWFIIHALILLGLVVLTVSYWLLFPYKTVTYNTKQFPVLNKDKVVKAGDVLLYHGDSCRHRVGEIRLHRALINHTVIDFPDTIFFQDKVECKRLKNASITIPSYAPSGVYHLEITNTMKVNPLREISTKVKTENFYVIGGDEK